MHAAAVFFLAVAALLLPIKSNVAADKPAGAVPRTPLEIGGSFKVRVVDDRGEPLAGCNVIATGLRSDPDRAHYRWVPSRHGPRPFTETDRQGTVVSGVDR